MSSSFSFFVATYSSRTRPVRSSARSMCSAEPRVTTWIPASSSSATRCWSASNFGATHTISTIFGCTAAPVSSPFQAISSLRSTPNAAATVRSVSPVTTR